MCGINGYIDFDLSPDHGKHLVNKMNSHLVHRGPDGKGTFIDGNIGLGHTRLSIIDLSVSANQPMTSLSKRSTLSFNGEIYNFINIKNELSKSYNISFNTSSDTEVLLNLLEYQGVDRALDQIEGMFAFAFNDSKTQCLYLARDRFGEKPLFYYLKNNKLYFSSELKPLMSVLKDSLTINYKNLDFFLKKSYLPIDESIFNEIRKVKPGQYLKIGYSDNVLSVSEHCYWDYGKLVIDSLQTKKESDFLFHKEQLKDLLKDKVNQAMISDVPLGAFLSGGYDSTCMVALMQSAKMNAVKTFSIGFDDKDFDEAPFAKAIANHIGTDHEELYVSRADLLDLIPKLPEIYSEPFADSSQIPTVLLSRLTRSHVTVSISGDGGDEIFGGYGRYVLGERVKSFFNYLPLHLRNFIKSTNSIDLSYQLC